jgi:hypothetical protein
MNLPSCSPGPRRRKTIVAATPVPCAVGRAHVTNSIRGMLIVARPPNSKHADMLTSRGALRGHNEIRTSAALMSVRRAESKI